MISIHDLRQKRKSKGERTATMNYRHTKVVWCGGVRQLLTVTGFLVVVGLLLFADNIVVCSALVSSVHRWLPVSRTGFPFNKRTHLYQTSSSEGDKPIVLELSQIHDADDLLPLRRAQSIQEAVRVIKGWTSSTSTSSTRTKTRQGQNTKGFDRQPHFLSTTHRASIPALMWNLLLEESKQQELALRHPQPQSLINQPPTGKGVLLSPSLLSELIWVVGTIRQPLPPPLLPYRQLPVLFADTKATERIDPDRMDRGAAITDAAAAAAAADITGVATADSDEDGSRTPEYSLAAYVIAGLLTHLTDSVGSEGGSVLRGDVVAKTAIGNNTVPSITTPINRSIIIGSLHFGISYHPFSWMCRSTPL